MYRQIANTKMVPKHVITVYENKAGYKHYLEARQVLEVNNKFTLGAPCPLSDNIFKEIAGSYMKDNSYDMDFGGMVPEHIIYADNRLGRTNVIWYRPAMERVLNFSEKLKIPGKSKVKLPALLGAISNSELYLFALMDNERPNGATKLYNAPFFNIYEKGNVCLGTAPVGIKKAKTFQMEVERFENGFFVSEQNHGHVDKCCKTPLVQLWTRLIRSKREFPSKTELIQHKTYKTLDSLINTLTRK